MIRRNFHSILVMFIFFGIFTSCHEDETCASAITELLAKGCSSTQLSKVMGVPESVIKKSGKHTFSEADSILLFSLLRTYEETGELPDNLYQLYSKDNRSQVRQVIENFRQEELKSNEAFLNKLCEQIIETQSENLHDFIESEVNSFKSLRFVWKSQDEISQELSEAIPTYLDEINVAKIYNDSCASYFNYLSRFRDNGVKRYIKKVIPQKQLNTIDTDVRGFIPEYQFENTSSHVTYQILATIDRAQDVLFTPINWLLELLPNWLMITISILLLVVFIVCLFTGMMRLGILDFILLVISAIVMFCGNPYAEVKDSMNNQVQVYYENKIQEELNHLNAETNAYYDNLIKILKTNHSNSASRKSSSVQASVEKNDGGDSGANLEKDYDGSSRTGDQNISEVNGKRDDSPRNEAPVPGGD